MGTKYSENVTNVLASPQVLETKKSGELKIKLDKVSVATGDIDNADDNIYMLLLPSNAKVLSLKLKNDDLDSNGSPALAANIGLVYTCFGTGQKDKSFGDVIDVDVFAATSDELQSANTSWVDIRTVSDDIVDIDKELWEAGGLTEDPGGLFAVVFDISTAAATAAAGDIVLMAEYI